MTDTLRDLDAEIARARGWERRERTSGILLPGDAWIAPSMEEAWAARGGLMECNGVTVHGFVSTNPPPFSSSWALAGPLLEEMRDGSQSPRLFVGEMIGEWNCEVDNVMGGPDVPRAMAATPCAAIARAWLAWRSKA